MMQQVPYQLAVTAFVVSVVLAGCLSGVTAVADELDQAGTPDTTVTAQGATGCQGTTSPNAGLISGTPTAANLSADHATELAEQYEKTYRNAQTDLDDRGSVGTVVQETNVTQAGDGYLVELEMVFGGQYTITAEQEPPTSVIEDGEVKLQTTVAPQPTVVNVDDFYTAYYFISANQVVRHETSRNGEPPENPQHGGGLLICRENTS